ncbi:MAG: flagellar biosynthesis protein FlgA, partial [Alphaproteobacteria bacterium]|nr:flagellar biosynthesis protein FlgA [Alphaproteobacteria bacterium]
MNISTLLKARAAEKKPLKVGLIGAGKFGAMFLSQALRTPGLHVLGVADLSVERAAANLRATGWPGERIGAQSFSKALRDGTTMVTDNAEALINAPGMDVVIEATGSPEAGIRHALACFDRGRDVVMVNVEADALAGPLLARRAQEAGS